MANKKRTFVFAEHKQNKIEHKEFETKRRKVDSTDNQMAVNSNEQNEDPFRSVRSAVQFMLIWIYNVPNVIIELILQFNTSNAWYRNNWTGGLCFKRVYEEIDAQIEYFYHGNARIFLHTTNSEMWCKDCNKNHEPRLNDDGIICNFILNEYFRKKKIKIKRIWMNPQVMAMFEDDCGKIYAAGRIAPFGSRQPIMVEPELIHAVQKVQQICIGHRHCVILDKKGTVFKTKRYGLQQFDAANLSNTIQSISPIYCFQNEKIIGISIGIGHSLFLTRNGIVWSCGSNEWCQLGHGDNRSVFCDYPKKIQFLIENNIKIQKCASGQHHNLLLDDHGNVYSFGCNSVGQCGLNISQETVALPKIIKMNKQFDDIQCGYSHSYMKSIGDIHFLFGCNSFVQSNLAQELHSPESLKKWNPDFISKPLAINEIVKQKVIGEFIKIKNVFLITFYTVINILEMQ